MATYAKVIADSINGRGDRLVTFEVKFHRFVLAEFNTHRVFSRNSASSRAIPVEKQLRRIKDDPAIPLAWPAGQKGMQGGDALSAELREEVEKIWIEAAEDAVLFAEMLVDRGLHKSVTNRILEPFMWHTCVVSATSWENFFNQRCSPLAQPEIRAAAEMMMTAYHDSTPEHMTEGDWHLPYIQPEDRGVRGTLSKLIQISAARCARVSYLTQDGVRDQEEDLKLYQRLITADPAHFSPLEHVASPDLSNWHEVQSVLGRDFTLILPKYGNFLGWQQLRMLAEADRQNQSFS